jgi:hypothetical protein
MKYRLAIFDFDGTLADSFPFFVHTVKYGVKIWGHILLYDIGLVQDRQWLICGASNFQGVLACHVSRLRETRFRTNTKGQTP